MILGQYWSSCQYISVYYKTAILEFCANLAKILLEAMFLEKSYVAYLAGKFALPPPALQSV